MPAARVPTGPEPPAETWDSYLQGKSELFMSRIDCELEVDDVVFPIHSAIVTNASAMLDQMLESFISSDSPTSASSGDGTPTVIPRIVLKRKEAPKEEAQPDVAPPQAGTFPALPQRRVTRVASIGGASAASVRSTASVEGSVERGAGSTSTVASGPPGTTAAGMQVQPVPAPAANSLSPHKLRLFLEHVYDGDRPINQMKDAIELLEMSDFFQAKSMRMACDRALVDIAKGTPCQKAPPLRLMELAAKYSLRWLMAHCMAAVLVWIAQNRYASSFQGQVSMREAAPYLDLLGSSLKNEVILELATRPTISATDGPVLTERFAATIHRLGWDRQ